MTNTIHPLLVLLGLTLVLPAQANAQAQEQELCLSCHQYPGLVRLEKSGGFKILHIDEQKYLASAHGKLHCKNCHRGVDRIPHAGANQTDCQSQCHQSAKDQQLLAKTPRKGFHRQQQAVITRLEDRTSCKVCHPIYPHKKEPFVRAFLNMHTGYLACEVCHLKRDKFDKLNYQWVDTEAVKFAGEPFGRKYDPLRKLTHKPDTILSRIAPFGVRKTRQPEALMNTWDTADAIQFQSNRSQWGKKEQSRQIRYYHRDVVKMARVSACEECHTSNGLLDFRRLGFSEARTETLVSMPIGNIIKKYEVFYLPKLGGM